MLKSAPFAKASLAFLGVVLLGAAGGTRAATLGKRASDSSREPAVEPCPRPATALRLTDGNGNIAPGIKVDVVRQLVLKEREGPGGTLEFLFNNAQLDAIVEEEPRLGSIEMWEIINETADAHPIHVHPVQLEILNRETFDADGTQGSSNPSGFGYIGVDKGDSTSIPGEWPKAFGSPPPARCVGADPLNPCPGFGPPLPYDNNGRLAILCGEAVPIVGGNPEIFPYLLGDARPPDPEEAGWKDTAKSNPGQVMRILLRWAPTSTPATPNRAQK